MLEACGAVVGLVCQVVQGLMGAVDAALGQSGVRMSTDERAADWCLLWHVHMAGGVPAVRRTAQRSCCATWSAALARLPGYNQHAVFITHNWRQVCSTRRCNAP